MSTSDSWAAALPELSVEAVTPAATPMEVDFSAARYLEYPETSRLPIAEEPVVELPDALIPAPVRPRIAIIIDDLGLSRASFDRVNDLPGPLTLAFLPYGDQAQGMIDQTADRHDVMLHLPMEPMTRVEDAGPDMLRVGMEAPALTALLEKNLAKLSGYSGVNNHTGSRFTADEEAMSLVLKALDQRGLYFVDSITTSRPVASRLAQRGGYEVLERNVFLDHDYANVSVETVMTQLSALEKVAKMDGYAIGIGHPYIATTSALASWLPMAEARGFEVVLVKDLLPEDNALARLE